MPDVINLNRARKGRAKASADAMAKANRVVHGRTRAEREAANAERLRASNFLEQHRLDTAKDSDDANEV